MSTEMIDALKMLGIILILTTLAVPIVLHRKIYNHPRKSKFKSGLKSKKNNKS